MLSKLGSAHITAMPSATMTAAAASMFRGDGYFAGFAYQLSGYLRGRETGRARELMFHLHEGVEGGTPFLSGDVQALETAIANRLLQRDPQGSRRDPNSHAPAWYVRPYTMEEQWLSMMIPNRTRRTLLLC
jgi:hypothetical protein